MKLTKIIATIGPATRTEDSILALYQNGVNVVRLNFSHKGYDDKKKVIDIVHKLNAASKTKLSILLDTKWPEIRTGKKDQKIDYHEWEQFVLSITHDDPTDRNLFCDYPQLLDGLQVGDLIRIESWLFDVEVLEVHADYARVKALSHASIGSYRHINLPGKVVKLPWMIDQDKEDVLFGIQEGVDVIAMSFVRTADNIKEMKEFLYENGWGHIPIIAKIENQEWLDNSQEIIDASDGIMVARGDLGIEVPVTMLPVYQQQLIDQCHLTGKPVIVATQMIESMIKEPFPTRAEIHDIYQAVVMGVDCVMLSGETAVGDYPVQAVKFMTDTIKVAQEHRWSLSHRFSDEHRDGFAKDHKYVIKSALHLAKNINAAAIFVFTKTGRGARIISAYKLRVPTIALTRNPHVTQQLNYYYGISGITLQNKQPVVDYQRLLKHYDSTITETAEGKPFVVISDTDTITGHYPTIQVISEFAGV